jgi:hypothetical protein
VFGFFTIYTVIVASYVAWHNSSSSAKTTYKSMQHFLQIQLDWQNQPYTEVVVIQDRSQPICPEGYDEAIYAIWPGTNMFCKCGSRFTLGEMCDEGSSCTTVSPSPAVPMDNLGDFKVCGKRNGSPFASV